jgi:hypothetical protein
MRKGADWFYLAQYRLRRCFLVTRLWNLLFHNAQRISFISLAVFMSITPVLFCILPFLPSYVRAWGGLLIYCLFFLFPIIVKVFFTYYNSGICLGSHICDRNVPSLLRYVVCFRGVGWGIFEQKPIKSRLENITLFPFHFLSLFNENVALLFTTRYFPA